MIHQRVCFSFLPVCQCGCVCVRVCMLCTSDTNSCLISVALVGRSRRSLEIQHPQHSHTANTMHQNHCKPDCITDSIVPCGYAIARASGFPSSVPLFVLDAFWRVAHTHTHPQIHEQFGHSPRVSWARVVCFYFNFMIIKSVHLLFSQLDTAGTVSVSVILSLSHRSLVDRCSPWGCLLGFFLTIF